MKVGRDPATGETVDARFIGRLTPASNRFNGAYTAGQGITDTVQSGNVFKVSPRLGFVFDVTGKGSTIVRGAGGIFYDRPMGNIVFDMGGNAPATLNSDLRWGRLQNLEPRAQGDPYPTLSMSPTAYDFNPPKVYAWNVGLQQKLPGKLIFDIAYVGSSSKNLVRRSNINAPALGATFDPANQDPTRPASLQRQLRAAHRLPAALPGLRRPQHVQVRRLLQLQLAADVAAAAVRQRVDVRGLLRLEQDPHDQHPGLHFRRSGRRHRWATTTRSAQYDYSYSNWDRPHNFVLNFVYQTPKVTDARARPARERVADLGCLPLVERSTLPDHVTRSPASPTAT